MYRFSLLASVLSDVGRVRGNNEDNYLLIDRYREDVDEKVSRAMCRVPDRKALFSVCDGMGGEEFGEVASLIAVSGMRPASFKFFREISEQDVLTLNDAVCEEMKKRGNGRMGSTLSNLYIDHGRALACNVGDSRTYLYRDGILQRLSVDHDEATRLVSLGILTPEQAMTDKRRHQLTQFLGMKEDEIVPEPYYSEEISIRDGDRFFLCSDGVTDVMTDEDIAAVLSENLSPEETVENLVRQSLERGSRDNCTALIVDVKKKPLLLYEF